MELDPVLWGLVAAVELLAVRAEALAAG